MREFQGEKRGATMTSALEDLFAMQLDAAGLTGYVREYAAIPGRRFSWDFAFIRERLLIEIQGGVWNGGAHGRPTGITRDMDKLNVATEHGWKSLQFETKMVKDGTAIKKVEAILKVTKQVCASCRLIQTSIRMPRGSEAKELVVKCEYGHAPIWLFSGGKCSDYQPKLDQTQEQTCTNE